jgi:hypothetical protein
MRLILICLAAVLLSGCGYIAGKRVDFGSEFKNCYSVNIQALSGKTFYITNTEDYERLIELKKEYRELSKLSTGYIGEPYLGETSAKNALCVINILKITHQYDSGVYGFLFNNIK